jgi:6-phosphogluconolactonase
MVAPPAEPVLYSFPSNDALVSALTAFIVKAQRDSIEKKGRFAVALSGGSLPSKLKGLIGHPDVKWDKWYVDHIKCILDISYFLNSKACVLRRRTSRPS